MVSDPSRELVARETCVPIARVIIATRKSVSKNARQSRIR
jgi:hypothetical protein